MATHMKFNTIIELNDVMCPWVEGSGNERQWHYERRLLLQDLLDVLRQWRMAELQDDKQELNNARITRDAIILKMLGELK